jgi:hypothetical protein
MSSRYEWIDGMDNEVLILQAKNCVLTRRPKTLLANCKNSVGDREVVILC